MRIDQRNAGAAVTINTAASIYTIDRWTAYGQGSDGVFTVQQSSTAPSGFTNSLAVTVTTADASISAAQLYTIGHKVEGYNLADLGWGTANAKTITMSFWVRSSLTGTFSGSLKNSDGTRSYPFTYTISVANTFEYKTITIAGDTSGTWLTTNGIGLTLTISLGSGSNRLATAGAWAAGNYDGATGAVTLISTNGATFYITGVQLEEGSVATPFEHRQYGQELALCQRYYYNSYPSGFSGTGHTFAGGVIPSAASIAECCVGFPVSMRTTPTVTFPDGLGQSGVAAASAATASQIYTTGFLRGNKSSGSFTSASSLVTGGFIASAEL